MNYAAYLHSQKAFGGKPQRYREVQADFNGHVAELLAKATNQSALEQSVSKEDREVLLEAMRDWGALDTKYEYKKSLMTSERRGLCGGSRRWPDVGTHSVGTGGPERVDALAAVELHRRRPYLRVSKGTVPAGGRHGNDR